MYITNQRLKEQIQFMNDQFEEEKERNSITAEYGFFQKSAAQIMKEIDNAKIGEGFMAPYICIVPTENGNQISMGNLYATRVADSVWSNDRSLFDLTAAQRKGLMPELKYDMSDYFNSRYAEYEEQPAIDPDTLEEVEANKPTFEEFLTKLK